MENYHCTPSKRQKQCTNLMRQIRGSDVIYSQKVTISFFKADPCNRVAPNEKGGSHDSLCSNDWERCIFPKIPKEDQSLDAACWTNRGHFRKSTSTEMIASDSKTFPKATKQLTHSHGRAWKAWQTMIGKLYFFWLRVHARQLFRKDVLFKRNSCYALGGCPYDLNLTVPIKKPKGKTINHQSKVSDVA